MVFDSYSTFPALKQNYSGQTVHQTASEQSKKLDYDVAIVGGGIVGLTFACALKESGLRIAVIEAKTDSAAVSRGQAYHINLMSSHIFEGIGAWAQMQHQVNPIQQIRLSDADHPTIVQFLPEDLKTTVLGYVADHAVVLEALRDFLHHCSNVTYLCPAEVVQAHYNTDQVELELVQKGENRCLSAQLLVAADGARSPIRQHAGIRAEGWQYWQSCVVAFIQPEKPHHNIAYERFWEGGPFAILPLPNNLCRIVWTAPKEEAKEILALNDQDFLARLKQRYGDQMGELTLMGQRYLFPVHLMHSRSYTLHRLALIGDAAHCCHPVGGQGVNLGIRDAAALAQVLQVAAQKGQDLGLLPVLRQYDRWRFLENLTILGFTDVLDRLFSNNLFPLVILRRAGLWVLQSVQPIKVIALKLMTGLLGRSPELAKNQQNR
ncbi:FAD-dependent hydroxylase [Phormidium sp. CLA17]|uniref:FAD-dependent hydroxylase n=1 Tax=Leptolyngbya sp. Cla-17 TaxID=2803751 RepID=UPI0014917A49|nr:FAD-dependent hydroxylase [Leptolyngbya sp. Cla-17]MBM0742975.1 FAD-dependent hydroxylase [Leptolyngbya sp. Cla-17]